MQKWTVHSLCITKWHWTKEAFISMRGRLFFYGWIMQMDCYIQHRWHYTTLQRRLPHCLIFTMEYCYWYSYYQATTIFLFIQLLSHLLKLPALPMGLLAVHVTHGHILPCPYGAYGIHPTGAYLPMCLIDFCTYLASGYGGYVCSMHISTSQPFQVHKNYVWLTKRGGCFDMFTYIYTCLSWYTFKVWITCEDVSAMIGKALRFVMALTFGLRKILVHVG